MTSALKLENAIASPTPTPFATDTAKWDAVCSRDATADGHFFYAVRTTGVFCYPSCAARRALRKNVAFYASRDEARHAGFRPCKRCRPEPPPAADRHTDTARYAVAHTSLGPVLVAATRRGVCAILLGDSAAGLREQLTAQLPGWRLVAAAAELAPQLDQVRRLIDDPLGSDIADVALDVRGTPFQRRVWSALQAIPVGSTASYAAIAAHIGAPTAVRAVVRACAANRLAVVIPCHRVVRSDGSLSGYRWGADRKQRLLARECA